MLICQLHIYDTTKIPIFQDFFFAFFAHLNIISLIIHELYKVATHL